MDLPGVLVLQALLYLIVLLASVEKINWEACEPKARVETCLCNVGRPTMKPSKLLLDKVLFTES